MQKGKKALQIAGKRREAKGKAKKERYTHLNADFEKIARRNKNAFLSDHCKETEEDNRMEKTRELFNKISYTTGTFHARMDTIKNRNGMNLTEAEDIKKRWQEYKELFKKDPHDSNNHDGVITHLEPDILECEFKWALGCITVNKASGGDGIPVELFQILKDDAVKSAALNMSANLENSAVATGLQKVSFHFNPKRQCQRMFKLLHNCTHLTLQTSNAQNSPSQASTVREL